MGGGFHYSCRFPALQRCNILRPPSAHPYYASKLSTYLFLYDASKLSTYLTDTRTAVLVGEGR